MNTKGYFRFFAAWGGWLALCLILLGCSSGQTQGMVLTPTTPPLPATSEPTQTSLPSTATATVEQITITPTLETSELAIFPLAEPGPFFVGTKSATLVDQSRGDREIQVALWYPALEQKDANGRSIRRDAVADVSGAPYPLILTGPNSGDMLFSDHLASHGFVMAVVRFPDLDYGDNWGFGVIDHPRDMVYVLDQLASQPPEGLEGVIDTDHAGVTGYSWDGFFSLALSGVRIDPEYYLTHCEQPPLIEPAMGADNYLEMTCSLANKWAEFTAHVGDEITASDDGLWQPVTDERIRATVPMAADGAWLYGERGLAAVDRPVLMIAPTEDEGIPYQVETRFIFENLRAPLKSLISFVGKGHMMVFNPEQVAQMRHFATAYLGYHLQGRQGYAEYFSEDFVSQFDDLAWGIYMQP